MFRIEELNIDLSALQEDSFEATYVLRDEYFNSLDGASIRSGNVCSEISLTKAGSGEYSLALRIVGEVVVQCDRCLDDMMQYVKAESSYTVRLGNEPDPDGDVIMVAEKDGVLSLAWPIYETIAFRRFLITTSGG